MFPHIPHGVTLEQPVAERLHPVKGAPRQSRWMPEGGCAPVGSLCWSRLLPGPVALWREELTLEQVCW